MRKGLAAALVTGSLLAGGAVGTAFFGPSTATAQTSSSSDSQSSQSTQSTAPDAGAPAPPDGRGPHRGMHRLDLSVAANTIGVSETDLRTALQSGQSIADVANAHGVDPQTVINALVTDAQQHLADDVSSGRLTQAQADQISADLTTHITDAVNHAGLGGPGGGGCPGMDGSGAPGSGSGSSSSSSDSANSTPSA
ncbi:MAG TPA: hypothetical protein VFV00_04775 [Acidimicrobiales bacterium]|nr:hypothetical protein [Acidimicrobiales bacterium]